MLNEEALINKCLNSISSLNFVFTESNKGDMDRLVKTEPE